MSGVGLALGEDVSFTTARSLAPLATKIESGLANFWRSLSSAGKGFLSGPGGKVVKAGVQASSTVALVGGSIYSLNKATEPEQKAIEDLTGSASLGKLFPIIVLAVIAFIIILVLVKK